MGYAKHIGRIGALAITLGVGVGIGTSPGIALADEPGTSTSSTADSSPGAAAKGTSHASPASRRAARKAARTHTGPSEDSQGGATTGTAAEDDTTAAEDVDAADPAGGEEKPEPTPARHRSGKAVRAVATAPRSAASEDASATVTHERTVEAAESAPSTEPGPDATTAARTAASASRDVPVEAADGVTAPAEPPVAEPTSVTLTSVLSSLFGRGGVPAVPAESPALWVLAAAARRQLGKTDTADAQTNALAQIAANSDPVAGAPVVSQPDSSGVVTGYVIVADADGDPLTYVVGNPGNGKVAVTQDAGVFSFAYTPTATARHAAASDTGAKTDSFILTFSDGNGGTATSTVTVAIAPVNAEPTARARSSVSLFSADVHGRIVVRDPDKDTVTFAATPTAKGGTVAIDEKGRFTYTPTAEAQHAAAAADATDADKTDTFDVTVADGHGGSTTVTVTVKVKPGNRAPTATVRTWSSPFSADVIGVVRARDAEKDPVTFTASPSAKGGTVTIDARGRFTYTPTDEARHAAAATDAPKRDTVDTFAIVVSDDHGGTTKLLVTVNIKPANAAPTNAATTDVFTSPNSGVVTGKVVASDPDGDALTYDIATGGRKGDVGLDAATGMFTYTPSAQARAAASSPFARPRDTMDSFRVTVDDGHGGTTTLRITVGIAPLGNTNQAPTDGNFTASQPNSITGKVTGTVTATDPERDVVTFIGSGPTPKGSVVVSLDGSFSYTPSDSARHQATADGATAADKQDTFTVTAVDGFGGSLDIPVTVAIKPSVNRAPTRGSYTTDADPLTGMVTGVATATDAESDALRYSGTTTTGKGSVIVAGNGGFTYTPTDDARAAAGAPGATRQDKQDTFDVVVDDGHGGTLTIVVKVPVVAAPALGVLV
ncbi:VCBS repeat-containing protein [Mycolicibacterium chubuense NBB4]|uniref:VCBS repeat-containing protein n=1 Tax=Mycolicibacterium chubuense (strain NBB4) TaxID=710421 RepID=I4BL21_MYCCN|nr:Ig-like domain-containing protein [Mycolicibacterium chubuense]AFM17978.1 VCBS repeat-containing protein [Mycolicibacterium chubuense NBB4]